MAAIYQPGAQAKSGATFCAGGALPYEQEVVMPGLAPASTFFVARGKAWMAGTGPARTPWKL